MTITVTPIPQLVELAAPAFTLGTANAAGSAATAIASDSTLLMFDAVSVDAITLGQSGSVGTAVVPPRRDHAHAMEAVTAASEVQMEAASSTTVFVTPGRTQNHPGVGKVRVIITGSDGSNTNNYNVTSTSRTSAGVYIVTYATDFSTAAHVVLATVAQDAANFTWHLAPASGSVEVRVAGVASGALTDTTMNVAAFGEQ